MRAGHLSPPRTHVPRTSARRNTNQEVNVLDDCYRGKGRCRGTNVRSHMVSTLGIRRVCGDKTSCPPRQLNGGCIETAPDSSLKRLHRAGGFYDREFNVTPASQQHSSRRQQ